MISNVDGLHGQLCDILKQHGTVKEVSKDFSSLQTDEDRTTFALNLLRKFNILPCKYHITDYMKNVEKSVEYRNHGNALFQKKKDSDALLLYTESIASAPIDPQYYCSTSDLNENATNSDALSLGYANRSAVLFSMKHYDACLMDIEQALIYKYPEKLKHKLLQRRGKCLQMKGKLEEARISFMEALQSLSKATLSDQKLRIVKDELQTLHNEVCSKDVCGTLTQSHQPPLPSKSHEEHRQIPSMSNCAEIKSSPEMGRYIEATKDIHPGDIIVVEKPYASVLLPGFYKTHCHNCLLRCKALIPCLYCSTVMYCSERCRTMSWESCHSIECSMLPMLLKLEINKIGLLALKIIIVASACGKNLLEFYHQIKSYEDVLTDPALQGFDKNGFYKSDNYCTIYNLVGNTEKRTVSDLFKRAVIAACLINCLEIGNKFFKLDDCNITSRQIMAMVGGLLLRHLQNLACNAHTVLEHVTVKSLDRKMHRENLEIGAAAYAVLSLINHSCDPNVTRDSHHGDIAVLKAVHPIRSGEQILDNYGYHYAVHQRAERQSHLQSQYYFFCHCNACSLDWPLYDKLLFTNPVYKCLECRSEIPNSQHKIAFCVECNSEINVTDMQKQLEISSEKFQKYLREMLAGSEQDFTTDLINHLEFLDGMVCKPWKEYNECQEALKECFSKTGNYYIL